MLEHTQSSVHGEGIIRQPIAVEPLHERLVGTYLKFLMQLANETDFMTLSSNDLGGTPPQVATRQVASFLASDHGTIVIAVKGAEIVGFSLIAREQQSKTRHTASVALGVLKEAQGMGVGRRLLAACEDWAIKKNISRLELTVQCDNRSAIALYEKMGFEIEGKRRASVCVRGVFMDELYMGKRL